MPLSGNGIIKSQSVFIKEGDFGTLKYEYDVCLLELVSKFKIELCNVMQEVMESLAFPDKIKMTTSFIPFIFMTPLFYW